VTSTDPFGLVGQVLDGQFRVDSHIGEGGFSVVYRGTHVGLSEPIAIKCLKLPVALGSALVESFVRRFRDESRIHYKLSQGNLHIVRSIASGTTLAPATSALVPYTVLEWLDGKSLADDFNARRDAHLRGRSLREVIALLDSAIDALAHAHAQGVVHRDLNPGNFFLARTPAGIKVKILDFGVAKVMADSTLAMGPMARTVGNVRMFAPAYGAPEQFDDRLGGIGPWTDVYAIALVILEALTDRTVVDGEHLGEFATRALDPARRPTPRALGLVVGDETEKVFALATAVNPAERPRDAGELWGMLKHAIQVDGSPRLGVARPSDPVDSSPVTLRMKERASPTSGRPGGALGGTLRMDPPPRGAPRSASEWLASTPLPRPVESSDPPHAPLRPVPPLFATPSTITPLPPPGRPSSATPYPVPPTSPPRSWAMALIVVGLVLLVLAGAAGVGWHVLHEPAAPTPAGHP
jgi:serine/threonine protein kinase